MNSQPMFITRHPRHRTGVHTCAVKTGSGTPGPPYHSHTRYSISRRAGRRAALKPRPVALIHTVAWSLTNQKKTTVARLLYQAQMLSNCELMQGIDAVVTRHNCVVLSSLTAIRRRAPDA